MKNLVVFASGNGSNFQAIADACFNKTLPAVVRLLVCNNPDAFAIKRAQKMAVPIYQFAYSNFSSKLDAEKAIVHQLQTVAADWIILAGYMRLLSPYFIDCYDNRILNIHPSLLPAYPGINAIDRAFDNKEKEMGVTVHFVDKGVDTGTIILQEKMQCLGSESRDDIHKKIHEIEQRVYVQAIKQVITDL
ncbi:MAG: phosphoribosylglycinamide formyltransferase [Phycisphaerales bacterium]|nr:phosphoribosylglycinamide formyltransferase [Phycisphaerales bacterium]